MKVSLFAFLFLLFSSCNSHEKFMKKKAYENKILNLQIEIGTLKYHNPNCPITKEDLQRIFVQMVDVIESQKDIN